MTVDVFYHDGFERGVAYPDREGIYIVGTSESDRIEVSERGGITTIFAARPTGMGFYHIETSKVPNIHFYGGGGNDSFSNQSSAEAYIYGGEGNDTLQGGKGHCHVYGEGGEDQISVGPLAIAELYGGDGRDTIWGGNLGDTIDGGSSLDVIYAGAGNDEVRDEAEGCIVFGGPGNDSLYGGPGRDSLYGEGDNDYLEGGEDDDGLFGGPGKDKLFGDGGRDHLEGGAGSDQLNGGPGRDSLVGFEYYLHFGGTSRNDFDKLIGEGGGDTFAVRYRTANGTFNADGQGIYDFNPNEGDKTFATNLESLTTNAYAASWSEQYQGGGAAPLAGTMDSQLEIEIGPYGEATWNELGYLPPLDEGSEFATLEDYISYLAADDDLVEGANEVAAIDAMFGELETEPELLDPAPVTYESGPGLFSAPALTNNSIRSGFRYSAF